MLSVNVQPECQDCSWTASADKELRHGRVMSTSSSSKFYYLLILAATVDKGGNEFLKYAWMGGRHRIWLRFKMNANVEKSNNHRTISSLSMTI